MHVTQFDSYILLQEEMKDDIEEEEFENSDEDVDEEDESDDDEDDESDDERVRSRRKRNAFIPPPPRELPTRTTRGQRLGTVAAVQDDQADEEFWNQEFFAEEERDQQYETESEPEDRFDADFMDSVSENDSWHMGCRQPHLISKMCSQAGGRGDWRRGRGSGRRSKGSGEKEEDIEAARL